MRLSGKLQQLGVWLALGLMMSACQLSLAKDGAASREANPITGGEVETTSLDAPSETATSETVVKPQDGQESKAKPLDMPAPKPRPEEATSKAADTAGNAKTGSPPEATPTVPPPLAQKSASQIACEKGKGVWTLTASGSAAFCQKPTRDGGKSCLASTDCEGYCLARSQTCAPVTPLFGCQDILNEHGRMLTQCID